MSAPAAATPLPLLIEEMRLTVIMLGGSRAGVEEVIGRIAADPVCADSAPGLRRTLADLDRQIDRLNEVRRLLEALPTDPRTLEPAQ